MKRSIQGTLFGVLILTSATGCQSDGLSPEATFTLPPYVAHYEYREQVGERTRAQIETSTQENMDLMVLLTDIAAESATWQEADQQVRAVLESNQPYNEGTLGQIAGTFMFNVYLKDLNEPSELQQEALAFYTELLVKNRSPEAVLIADAIERLEGYWPDSKRSSIAEQAVGAAQSYLNRRIDCGDCSVARTIAHIESLSPSNEDVFLRRSADAMQRLSTIVDQ